MILAAFALEITVGISASSSLARIVLALVDIFTDSLLSIVLVALVAGASVGTGCVLALAIDARIVKGALVNVVTGFSVGSTLVSNFAYTLVVSDDI